MSIKQILISTKKLFLILGVGISMGLVSALFLFALNQVTTLREHIPWLLLFLPIISVSTAFIYKKFGKGSEKGNNLIIEEMLFENTKIPFRMGPLTFIFTCLSHLVGASVGREGTAVQMGGVIGNIFAFFGKMPEHEKKLLIFAGVSAGFGSVFGTPFAGAFFAMEMCEIGKIHRDVAFPCFLASFTANTVSLLCGTTHSRYVLDPEISVSIRLVVSVFIASVLFGLVARFFSYAVSKIKSIYSKIWKNPYIRAFATGIILLIIIILAQAIRYEGLSTWMIDAGFHGQIHWYDPIEKLILTILSLGSGFQGGEATPLFDVGASLGGLIANIAHISPSLLAALGYICIFGNAANVPLTSIAMGLELFGVAPLPYFVVAVIIGYYVTGHNSIYKSQRIAIPKYSWKEDEKGKSINNL